MTTFELIAYSGAAILLLACAFKIISAETLTLHLYGIEIKAEGSRPSLPPAKD
jgi:predicted outer membrane lipoprotein